MTTLIPTAILLLSLAGGAGIAADPYGSYDRQPGNAPYGEPMGSLLQAIQAASHDEGPRDRVLRTVFVVPGPDLAPEGMMQISEDLAIMCRIFDKAAIWAQRTAASEMGRAVPVDVSGVEISEGWILTQALYLDGYGALFFLPVDFPLAAPPQEQAASETESSGDPLWSQTADELRGAAPQESATPAKRQYDAQRVENLKTALIGTLRHAANLRTRGPQDAVIVAVSSRTEQVTASEMMQRAYLSRYEAAVNGGRAVAAAELPSVLILRTTKSDVDALAKGSLSQEQFAGKVQILKSWTTSNTETAPTGMVRPKLSAPSRIRR